MRKPEVKKKYECTSHKSKVKTTYVSFVQTKHLLTAQFSLLLGIILYELLLSDLIYQIQIFIK